MFINTQSIFKLFSFKCKGILSIDTCTHKYTYTQTHTLTLIHYTVGENIIATIKMRNNFCYPLKMVIFQYCDSNIGLFSIAPH